MIPAPVLAPATSAAAWSHESRLELGALPSAVPSARLHARLVLWEWGLDGHADTVELIVSELVTNAVRASGGLRPWIPVVRLWLRSDRDRVVVQVWDGDDEMPVRQDPELDAESGRGLMLVEHLSLEWGSYRPRNPGGKVVWSVIAMPPHR